MNNDSKIFGIYPVLEAIKSETVIDKVYLQKGSTHAKLADIEKLLEAQHTSINYVPVEKLDKLTRGNHQGVVAIVSPIGFLTIDEVVEKALSADKPPLFLILDQISDVRNFGAIIRTAECTGVDGIIISKSCSCTRAKLVIAVYHQTMQKIANYTTGQRGRDVLLRPANSANTEKRNWSQLVLIFFIETEE